MAGYVLRYVVKIIFVNYDQLVFCFSLAVWPPISKNSPVPATCWCDSNLDELLIHILIYIKIITIHMSMLFYVILNTGYCIKVWTVELSLCCRSLNGPWTQFVLQVSQWLRKSVCAAGHSVAQELSLCCRSVSGPGTQFVLQVTQWPRNLVCAAGHSVA